MNECMILYYDFGLMCVCVCITPKQITHQIIIIIILLDFVLASFDKQKNNAFLQLLQFDQ